MPQTFHHPVPYLRLFPMALALLILPLMMAPELSAQNVKPAVLQRKIIGTLRFTNGTLSGPVTEAEIRSMGERKLRVAEGDDTFLTLDGELVPTPSLDAYGKAMKDGGSIQSWFGNARARPFVRGFGILEFLRNSIDSRVSYFSEHWMGALSVELIGWDEPEEKVQIDADVQAGKTLLDYAAGGLDPQNWTPINDHEIELLASGDLDHDGAEDRLILIKSWSREGTGSSTTTHVVSWKKRSDKSATGRSYPEGNVTAH